LLVPVGSTVGWPRDSGRSTMVPKSCATPYLSATISEISTAAGSRSSIASWVLSHSSRQSRAISS
jgi:hypothetical protein